MEDEKIIELYFERSQQAIVETDIKYGKMCLCIAKNIIDSNEEAEECVNDTYLGMWNSIPPTIPKILSAYIAKITRNIAMNKVTRTNAKKRADRFTISLEELDSSVTALEYDMTENFSLVELAKRLEDFLKKQNYINRNMFLRRYWFMDSIQEIAERFEVSEDRVRCRLCRTKNKLRKYLIKEGYML